MIIRLSAVDARTPGVYPLIRGKPNRTDAGHLPERFRYLHPEAAQALCEMEPLRISDMLRSGAGSMQALKSKRGVKAPGYSGHNYGLSIDIDVVDCLRTYHVNKDELDSYMETFGWHCHRTDGELKRESWHYNFLDLAGAPGHEGLSSAATLEMLIQWLYSKHFTLTLRQTQCKLKRLRYYRGEVDGIVGPLTRKAMRKFRRDWRVPSDTIATRTLAFLTARQEVQS